MAVIRRHWNRRSRRVTIQEAVIMDRMLKKVMLQIVMKMRTMANMWTTEACTEGK